MKAVVTVIGRDKIGIIKGVAGVLSENFVNILEITQTILSENLTMIMIVDLKDIKVSFKELKENLELAAKELDILIKIQHEDIFKSMHEI